MNFYRVGLGISLLLNTAMAIVLPKIVYSAYVERGCEFHFGGEWLLMWGVVLVSAVMFFERKEN